MYNHPSQFEPLLIASNSTHYGRLITLAQELSELNARLDATVHADTALALAELVRGMNCYYSNLIEGHHTLPLDIARALQQNFSQNYSQNHLQQLAWAHITTTQWAATVNVVEYGLQQFILDAHQQFYQKLPAEMLQLSTLDGNKTVQVIPGAIRTYPVQVGLHIAPDAASIVQFMERYQQVYQNCLNNAAAGGLAKLEAIIGCMLAHHRLAWLHPFGDGNGRVARIALDAMLKQTGIAASNLWSISRGFAKTQSDYKRYLAEADMPRMGDLDGRGNLSESRLAAFAEYSLNTAINQVKYMSKLFALDSIEPRIQHYFRNMRTDLRPESAYLYMHALSRGRLERGDAPRITGLLERTARDALSQLIKEGFLLSETPKGQLRVGFPVHALGTLLPNLYPAGDLDFATP